MGTSARMQQCFEEKGFPPCRQNRRRLVTLWIMFQNLFWAKKVIHASLYSTWTTKKALQKIAKIREERDRCRMLCLKRERLAKENYLTVMATIAPLSLVHRLTLKITCPSDMSINCSQAL